MKKLFFTGGAGFLGRNLIPLLTKEYQVYAPSREDLDLREADKLSAYLKKHQFDVVIHAAIPDLLNCEEDKNGDTVKNSMAPFLNLSRLKNYYGKMLYFGSGAEYDKSKPICSVQESDVGNSIPLDDYGFSKYLMNELCRSSGNIYNLRIFGCFGPTDAGFKLITSAIRSCLGGRDIHLHQNCYFDFMYVENLYPILCHFIENTPRYHDYNVCSGRRFLISDICEWVKEEMDVNSEIVIEKDGLNHEYTAKNERLVEEFPNIAWIPLREGIRRLVANERTLVKVTP